ncbi:hypothetical protein [Hymenobacter psychrophilus]|uniref:Uncharacterized protein n=1 Tax=Hymenobacter psychrophilus TaxID=651662 RepID=A0A1H3NUF4_9BACT|nr:hypothetical protein [Hymenobacter psychrophilus]SDY92340.1 hypothetical protein SAMN04488069_11913 [Hymenobacter psychrophilus]
MGIEKPKIEPRQRIPVSAERRNQARAGMDGELVKSTSATTADAAPAVTDPAVAPLAPVDAPVAPKPTLAPVAAPEPSAASTSQPASPVQSVATVAPTLPAAAPIASPVARPRRGRKPAAPDAVLMETERSVKIPESVWNEIRLALVLLPKGEDSPVSIKAYLVAAHRHYEAQLRKQGKLPAKPAESK